MLLPFMDALTWCPFTDALLICHSRMRFSCAVSGYAFPDTRGAYCAWPVGMRRRWPCGHVLSVAERLDRRRAPIMSHPGRRALPARGCRARPDRHQCLVKPNATSRVLKPGGCEIGRVCSLGCLYWGRKVFFVPAAHVCTGSTRPRTESGSTGSTRCGTEGGSVQVPARVFLPAARHGMGLRARDDGGSSHQQVCTCPPFFLCWHCSRFWRQCCRVWRPCCGVSALPSMACQGSFVSTESCCASLQCRALFSPGVPLCTASVLSFLHAPICGCTASIYGGTASVYGESASVYGGSKHAPALAVMGGTLADNTNYSLVPAPLPPPHTSPLSDMHTLPLSDTHSAVPCAPLPTLRYRHTSAICYAHAFRFLLRTHTHTRVQRRLLGPARD